MDFELATKELSDQGITTHISVFDVNDEATIVSEVQRLEKEVGPIEILFNNAGLNLRHKLTDMPLEDWKTVLDINLTGAGLAYIFRDGFAYPVIWQRTASGPISRAIGSISGYISTAQV